MGFMDIFSSDTSNKIIDNVSSGIDKAWFTDEEKSDAFMKILDTKLKIALGNGNFQIAQRYLAFLFGINFLLAFWFGVAVFFLGSTEDLKSFLSLVGAFYLGWIMVAIITFYFGGGFANSLKFKKKAKA